MNATVNNPEDGDENASGIDETQAAQNESGEAAEDAQDSNNIKQVEADVIAAMQQARAEAGGAGDEVREMKEQLLRAVAEAENVRKRAKREVEDAAKYSIASFARDLISVLENLQRASESIPPEARSENEMLKTLGEGVDLTLKELLNTFEKHGITRINPLGEKFDHNLHQAVVQIEDPSHPPGTVVQVMQSGYVLNDRLLRPAMVGVAKAPANADNAPPPVDTQA